MRTSWLAVAGALAFMTAAQGVEAQSGTIMVSVTIQERVTTSGDAAPYASAASVTAAEMTAAGASAPARATGRGTWVRQDAALQAVDGAVLTLGSDAATAGSARGLRVECAPELCFSERSSQAAVWRGGESAAATTDAADGAERAALPGSGARRVVRILLPDV